MQSGQISDNPWVAGACWLGAPFGGLLPGMLLAVTWQDHGSLVRRHALRATIFWAVLMTVYLPVFVFRLFIPSFNGESPSSWVLAVVGGIFVVSWIATVFGVVAVRRSVRHTAGPTAA